MPATSRRLILVNHSQCYYCHLYENGTTADYDIDDVTQHRDGNIEIGAGATDGSGTQLGFTDNTATVGCDNCHLSSTTAWEWAPFTSLPK